MRLFITGGAGFIGSNFIRQTLRTHPDYHLVNFDKLTYAGNLDNLKDIEESPNYTFIRGDICDRTSVDQAIARADTVINFAAESHVDRSIENASAFVQTNVLGTQVLLDAARAAGVKRFFQISTDEVMGSCGESEYFTESSAMAPNSPYAASKAAAEHLVRAAHVTFGLDVVMTRASNNYGPYQFPEKLIPLVIINALNDKPLPVYGDGLYVRDWLYVADHCAAIDAVLHRGSIGEVYNIGGNNEWKNIDLVRLILARLGKPVELIRFVKDRPGHDRRYAIDASKLRDRLGWKPARTFDEGISQTIEWYSKNRSWWMRVMTGEYLQYYSSQYPEG